MASIKIAGIVEESIVDGPGIRYTIFIQGCNHFCKNCHNEKTHDINKGYFVEDDFLLSEIMKNPLIDGVTISGGEPFLQADKLKSLARKIKEQNISLICYTGYTIEEIISSKDEDKIALLNLVDYLIDGPFIEEEKDLNLNFRGSKNQRIIDVKKTFLENKIIVVEL